MSEQVHQLILHSHDPEETETIGERLGVLLASGDVVALYGDLGSGKTVIVKGIARGIGIQAVVHSPTFTLVHEYAGPLVLCHIDLYRVDASEIDSLGLEEYMESEAVVAVEWAEKIKPLLPAERIDVTIRKTNEFTREIAIAGKGARAATIVEGLTHDADACI